MHIRLLTVIAAAALAGLAAWPSFVATREAQASGPTPAPVLADYAHRNQLVSFYEGAVRTHPDQIVSRLLAAQYLQRFRETGDVGDLVRGEAAARRSLALQPRSNASAEMALASALVSLHRFREALAHAQNAARIESGNPAAEAQVASTQVELGRYDDAQRVLRSMSAQHADDVAHETAAARYEEVAGSLPAARRSIDRAMVQIDSVMDNPAESRAWFHFRAGELAWSEGDAGASERRFREALTIFPNYTRALNGLARMYWGEGRWAEALDAATRAADVVPLPETLGYKADAQRGLGAKTAAAQTDDLIAAIARVGNAGGINDRALSLYFADHGRRLDDAVAIARRDVAARDDAFAEDTLAWALARRGRWAEARIAAAKATRRNTRDARLEYHAGVIAMKTGDRGQAVRRFTLALALNPHFHPFDANDARRRLARLEESQRSAASRPSRDVSE